MDRSDSSLDIVPFSMFSMSQLLICPDRGSIRDPEMLRRNGRFRHGFIVAAKS